MKPFFRGVVVGLAIIALPVVIQSHPGLTLTGPAHFVHAASQYDQKGNPWEYFGPGYRMCVQTSRLGGWHCDR